MHRHDQEDLRSYILTGVTLSNEVIVTIKNNIGDIKFIQNDFENAFLLYDEVYKIRSISRDSNAKGTSIAAFNVRKCLHCLGRSGAARRYYEIFTKSLFSSPNLNLLTNKTILAIQSIAWAFHQEHNFQHARSFYQLLSLRSAIHVFGEEHKVVAHILNQLSNLSFEFNHMSVALNCYRRGLLIESALVPSSEDSHNDALTTLSSIARTYEAIGCTQESLQCYEKLVAGLKSTTLNGGDISRVIQVSDALSNIAQLQDILGRPNRALLALTEALNIQRQQFGNDHSAVASTLNEIGITFRSQGQTHLALQNFEESLRIRQMLNDPVQNVSTVLFNLARAQLHNGEHKKAILRFQDLVQLELRKRENCGGNSESTLEILLDTLEQMAIIFQNKLDEPRHALSCYEKGIQLFTDVGPWEVSLDMKSRYLGMAGNICLMLGDINRATSLFSETSMRVNVEAGWAFNANIKTTGYDLFKIESMHRSAAPAA
jgi:tetratricopeptide (TPR) repeat protein